jgi:hypothetical protein
VREREGAGVRTRADRFDVQSDTMKTIATESNLWRRMEWLLNGRDRGAGDGWMEGWRDG